MTKTCLLLITVLLSLSAGPVWSRDCAILLHGLARSAQSMEKLEAALARTGYLVVNVDYPSRHYPVEDLSAMTLPAALAICDDHQARTIDIVTHSLGGILLRHYLQSASIPALRRVVMLGPPNQGSEVVDRLKEVPGFLRLNGPAGQQLGTGQDDLPRQLPPVTQDLGVIAGSSSINWILSGYLPNPDDGKVSVANTRVEGMCAHVTLPVSHPFLMKDAKAIEQVLAFLQQGHFTGETAETLPCPAREHEDRE